MQLSPASIFDWSIPRVVIVVAALQFTSSATTSQAFGSPLRHTAIVKAVARAKDSVVSIRGQKTIHNDRRRPGDSADREVNGMGTGVIIDSRGYIITNHHVVQGVRNIQVTLVGTSPLRARIISYDPKTDLAIIKVDPAKPLPVIVVGTSSDLMTAEPVVAVGNAYGYEHTVTRGIISALHRDVQVSDAQDYRDLIQTDASINPGNSGGPLLNIDGEMIGINVAVRAGAQGIGFAIPVDKAMAVAAQLLSIERLNGTWHGIIPLPSDAYSEKGLTVKTVSSGSPAQKGSIKPGDVIQTIAHQPITRPLDLERSLLGRPVGEEIEVLVQRGGKPLTLSIVLARMGNRKLPVPDRNWDLLGMRLAPADARRVRQQGSRYRGGLRVVSIRRDGPARKQGIRIGDILVGMHIWETISLDNVEYILNRPDLKALTPIKFYVLRDGETRVGHLNVKLVKR